MKYDRPVWQLMYACAAAMPDPFGYEHVHRWFAHRYPDVGQATIRAHLVGLCEGGRPKQPQFAVRAPLFRRVARGLYEVIPPGERKLDPDLPDGLLEELDAAAADVPELESPRDVRARPGAEHATDVGPPPSRFATEAFSEATVVEARGDRGPTAPSFSTFEEIVERAGLAGPRREVPDPTAESADVLLLAGAGERVLVPAPAREIYRAEGFQAARLRAQARGATWFVLSAEHGLLEPGEWSSPDSRELGDLDPAYRSVWAQWVLARLESLDGPVDGRRVHLVAPGSHVGPLAAVLQDAGAEVTVGVEDASHTPAVPLVAAVPAPDEPVEVVEVRPRPAASGEPGQASDTEVAAAAEHLARAEHGVPAQDLDALLDLPGLFAWHVDADGARLLNRSLMLPVGAGVLYVGHAGAVGRSDDVVTSVRQLVQDVQLNGRSRASTFRSTLATILQEPLRARSLDDPAVRAWMERHLRVVVWPTDDRAAILGLAHRVVETLEPRLNVDHLRAADVRRRLTEMRRALD